jgi:hypothetical protein
MEVGETDMKPVIDFGEANGTKGTVQRPVMLKTVMDLGEVLEGVAGPVMNPVTNPKPVMGLGDLVRIATNFVTDPKPVANPVMDPVTDEPVTDDPVTDDPVTDDPVTVDPVMDPMMDTPVTDAYSEPRILTDEEQESADDEPG